MIVIMTIFYCYWYWYFSFSYHDHDYEYEYERIEKISGKDFNFFLFPFPCSIDPVPVYKCEDLVDEDEKKKPFKKRQTSRAECKDERKRKLEDCTSSISIKKRRIAADCKASVSVIPTPTLSDRYKR